MGNTATWVFAIGGTLAIGASLWRIGTGVLRLVRRFDTLMREHVFLLNSARVNSEAILKLSKRMDRMSSRNG